MSITANSTIPTVIISLYQIAYVIFRVREGKHYLKKGFKL
jgi:hypothetical protein